MNIGAGITFGAGISLTSSSLTSPGAPTIGSATATGSTTATVAFTAPVNNGGSTITSYTATSSPGGITGTLSQAGSGTINMTGLTASTSYTFTVTATNAIGTSSPSASSNSITTTATPDSYFEYNSLLLPGNGTNLAQNNTFLDGSTNNFTITRYGNTTQGTFSPYGPNWSNYFDGTGDYLSAASSSAFNVGTNSFCIEFWIYTSGFPSGGVVDGIVSAGYNTNVHILGFNITGFRFYVAGSFVDSTTAINLNAWNHVAFVRNGTIGTIYVNGVASGTGTLSGTGANSALYVGTSSHDVTETFTGYLSNVRFVNGSAVYTSNFTPPTTPLTAIANTSLLTSQSNRFIDNSTNAFAITRNGDTRIQRFSPFSPSAAYSTSTTGGSGYFDGANDYLLASSASVTLPGDFTVECWIYPTSFTAVPSSAYINYGTYVTGGFAFNSVYGANDGSLWFYSNARGPMITSTINTVLNSWNHIAVVRSGSTLTMYINGQSAGTASAITETFTTGSTGIFVGNDVSSEYAFGYISDARIATSAVYTGAFTPPTTPLTAISGTQFLASMTNAGIIDNAMMNNLETVGDAKISTTQSKFGGSSMSFDGTGDYLITPANPVSNLGTGDFTIEMWVYLTNSSATTQTIMGGDLSTQSASTNTIQIWYNNGLSRDKISFNVYGNPRFDSSSSVSINNWMHLAFTRSSGTFKMFINGTQEASGSLPNNLSNNVFLVGRGYISFNQEYFYGYINDLRVTKGVARYTANFTPPTAAFPTY